MGTDLNSNGNWFQHGSTINENELKIQNWSKFYMEHLQYNDPDRRCRKCNENEFQIGRKLIQERKEAHKTTFDSKVRISCIDWTNNSAGNQ